MDNSEGLIQKLTKLLEENGEKEPYIFKEHEVEDIKYLLVVLQRARALGWFGKYLLGALVVVGLVLSNFERIAKWF